MVGDGSKIKIQIDNKYKNVRQNLGGNAPNSYSRFDFLPGTPGNMSEFLSLFSSVPTGKCWESTSNRPRPFPS